jgi:outer membrane protein OmpA-like peptidoglycan-associated protein
MTTTEIRSIQKCWFVLAPIALLSFLVSGCGPSQQEIMAKDRLETAKGFYERVKSNPDVHTYAPAALYDAQKAMSAAEQAKDYQQVEHLTYMAERKAQMATAVAGQRKAEKETASLSKEIGELVLQKRDEEARLARADAEKARLLAMERASEAEKARMDAEAKAREAEKARMEIEAKGRQLEEARRLAELRAEDAEKAKLAAIAEADKAAKARAEAALLAKEVSSLKAKQTDRGIVFTVGDVLFETGKANLFPAAIRTINKLAEFLEKYSDRNVLIEGHTDSVGSEEYNLGLSERRADAVREEWVKQGISSERIFTRGYGKKYPEASNDTAAGRQQNRRVEVVILREGMKPEAQLRD